MMKGLLLLLALPAAGQETDFAARLAAEVSSAAAAVASTPVVIAVAPLGQAGLGALAADWARVEHRLWLELSRGGAVVPVPPDGRAHPRLNLVGTAAGTPEGLIVFWRLHDADDGRLLSAGQTALGAPSARHPPAPAPAPDPPSIEASPAVMAARGIPRWFDVPLLQGAAGLSSSLPIWAGAGPSLTGEAVAVGASAFLRDRRQLWEAGVEFLSWSRTRADEYLSLMNDPSLRPYKVVHEASFKEFRLTAAALRRVPTGLPGRRNASFSLHVRPAAGIGFRRRQATRTEVRLAPGSAVSTYVVSSESGTRVVGNLSLLLGCRFRESLEAFAGPEFLIGPSRLDPTDLAPGIRWSLRANLRLF